ncbi:MAG TPA: tRNA (adenosine(37)-N6)-threonylcarbamoyltransferase complex ATPase subunit type 1 TsaE, partial [Geobacteraceae bacterium]|nr:tRNA (adenosine(37)-N6)-threonylcarbamoyltransferase complex ATPase subunit type 1 TsaE [Geobacteraceae bacterium]
MVVFDSGSPTETEKLGALIGELLVPGDFIALRGELGAGKTRIARGVAT